MGFSTTINPYTNRQTLCCDFCGGFKGQDVYGKTVIKWVRKIPCPYGYCQAWATCDLCYAQGKHKEHSSADPTADGKNHLSCKNKMKTKKQKDIKNQYKK